MKRAGVTQFAGGADEAASVENDLRYDGGRDLDHCDQRHPVAAGDCGGCGLRDVGRGQGTRRMTRRRIAGDRPVVARLPARSPPTWLVFLSIRFVSGSEFSGPSSIGFGPRSLAQDSYSSPWASWACARRCIWPTRLPPCRRVCRGGGISLKQGAWPHSKARRCPPGMMPYRQKKSLPRGGEGFGLPLGKRLAPYIFPDKENPHDR
jgi:hypothetical protein